MSTLIATPGFESQPLHLQGAKSVILVVSLISAIFGWLNIRFITAKRDNRSPHSTPNSVENHSNSKGKP